MEEGSAVPIDINMVKNGEYTDEKKLFKKEEAVKLFF
jgi:hypothetical protein